MSRKIFIFCALMCAATLKAQTWNCGAEGDGSNNLTDINIPATVTSLGLNTFQSLSSLTRFYNHAVNPQPVGNVVFDRTDISKVTLYVPRGSAAAYKAHDVWSKFIVVEMPE